MGQGELQETRHSCIQYVLSRIACGAEVRVNFEDIKDKEEGGFIRKCQAYIGEVRLGRQKELGKVWEHG